MRWHKGAMLAAGMLAVAALVGCVKKEAPSSTAPASGPAATPASSTATPKATAPGQATPAAAPALATGPGATITGKVLFKGTPPTPKPINFGPEVKCAALHTNDDKPVYETVVINPNGTLKWVLVSIEGAVPGEHKPPKEPAVVDQSGCVFKPHAVAMMVGQELEFHNSDPLLHNVRASPKSSVAFNFAFPEKGPSERKKIVRPEIGIPLKCDVHFWMSAFVHVLPHPFFALTGDDGAFTLQGVPPGTYTIQAWHETYQQQKQEVTVGAGETKTIEFTFSAE